MYVPDDMTNASAAQRNRASLAVAELAAVDRAAAVGAEESAR